MKSAYKSCDLFALVSICETPGIAALEAASQGAKVVITSGGSTSEYFEDDVTYVNPLHIENISLAIDSELGLSRGNRLKNRILEEFTWEKTAKDIIDGYKRIF